MEICVFMKWTCVYLQNGQVCEKDLISLKKILAFKASSLVCGFVIKNLVIFFLGQIWETKKSNLGYTKMNH